MNQRHRGRVMRNRSRFMKDPLRSGGGLVPLESCNARGTLLVRVPQTLERVDARKQMPKRARQQQELTLHGLARLDSDTPVELMPSGKFA